MNIVEKRNKKPVYRASSLTEYELCGYAWYLNHKEGRRGLGSFYSARGTGHHAARELNLRQKIKTFRDLPLAPMLDAARDKINEIVADDGLNFQTEHLRGLGKKAAAGKIIDATVRMVAIDRENLQSRIQPWEVEVTIRIELPTWPFDLTMRCDSIDADNYITDSKTARMKWTQQRADSEYQPKIYKLGYMAHCKGRRFAGFRYHIITATPKRQRLTAYQLVVNPSIKQIRAVLDRIEMMHKSIEAGVFKPCHRGNWKCSAEYCSFYRECKYV